MVIQDQLVCAGCCIKPGSEQDWLTYWGVCSYSLFQPTKKSYTWFKLVTNTRAVLVFQMLWNAQLNTAHLLSPLAKRNHPVPMDSALAAVTHFLLSSLMNTGNTKTMKLSTCVKPIQPRRPQNMYPCHFSAHQDHLFLLTRFNASCQSPVFPVLVTGEKVSSASQADAWEVNACCWSFWGHYRCGGRVQPSTRTAQAAKPPRTSRSQSLHSKAKAILLTSKHNKNQATQLWRRRPSGTLG